MKFSDELTVLMPVYNAEKNVLKSINSILNQTYIDFTFLIINDGSTDLSKEIINRVNDERIIFIENEKNLGIVKTLNRGLEMIDSKYIVRMDADDISYPKRLEKQIKFMDDNSELAVSGTGALTFVGNNGKKRKRVLKTKPEEIRSELFFNTGLLHPTVIMRNSVIKEENYRYNDKYKNSEDYGLWQEISIKYDLANMEDLLLRYQIHEDSITQQADKNMSKRDAVHISLHQDYFKKNNIHLTQEELRLWRFFNSGRLNMNDEAQVIQLNKLINKIKGKINWEKFDQKNFDSRTSFRFRKSSLNSGLTANQTINIYINMISSFEFDLNEKIKLYAENIVDKLKG